MTTVAMIAVIAFLVLLLTGTLGSVLAVAFQIIGWVIVALLVIGVIYNLIEKLEDRRVTKRRQSLGYDQAESGGPPPTATESRVPVFQRQLELRREFGYTDSTEHKP